MKTSTKKWLTISFEADTWMVTTSGGQRVTGHTLSEAMDRMLGPDVTPRLARWGALSSVVRAIPKKPLAEAA